MTITEFFDIHSDEHLRAYAHLQTTGCWPVGFVPEGIEFQTGWHMILMGKMAEAWVSYNLLGSD